MIARLAISKSRETFFILNPNCRTHHQPSMAPKRKDAPTQGTQGRKPKQAKIFDARKVRTQTSDAAFSQGELNVDKFVKAREFEIKALEDGIQKAKHGLSTRAHQELPKELRRRTASHNVKRVPKRLRERAKKEVCCDSFVLCLAHMPMLGVLRVIYRTNHTYYRWWKTTRPP